MKNTLLTGIKAHVEAGTYRQFGDILIYNTVADIERLTGLYPNRIKTLTAHPDRCTIAEAEKLAKGLDVDFTWLCELMRTKKTG